MDEPAVESSSEAGGATGAAAIGTTAAGATTAGATATGAADEAARVLERLERIEALDRERAPAGQLLGELRELVHEAEAWARAEAGGRGRDAVAKVREEAEGMR